MLVDTSQPDWKSEFFRAAEFRCKCGRPTCGAVSPKPRLIDLLDQLRRLVGRPLHITSGVRCRAHNAAVGGSRRSQHMFGAAADIACATPAERDELEAAAKRVGFLGFGIGRTFLHLDVRRTYAKWIY